MTLLQLKYAITIDEERSMRRAARKLYVSQPRLSVAIKELEEELGITIFNRVHSGVVTTNEGREFLAHARNIMDEYSVLEVKYAGRRESRTTFSVSMQHYMFAVEAYIQLIREYAEDQYYFTVKETRTNEVISDVKNYKSEVGVIAINPLNRSMMRGFLGECKLTFHELFRRGTYVYVSKEHPLADREEISLNDLQEYPYLAYDQGDEASFYFREEVLADYDHRKVIYSNDRASSADIIKGCSGYTIGVGVLSGVLSDSFVSIRLKEQEEAVLGYIIREGQELSEAGKRYIEILKAITAR